MLGKVRKNHGEGMVNYVGHEVSILVEHSIKAEPNVSPSRFSK